MPHPSHRLPRSSTPALGQSLDCNLPLPLKLAVGEEFRASRLPTFIKGCCFPPPPQLPCCPSPPNTCCGQKPSDEVGRAWPPSLSSGPHIHLPPAWEGVLGPQPCCHHQPMHFELRSRGEQSSHKATNLPALRVLGDSARERPCGES